MSESAAPRSHRREQAQQKADDLLDELFEDLDSGLRTTPILPRQWGSRFHSPLYPEGYGAGSAHKGRWLAWCLGAGAVAVVLASWGLWRSYSSLVTQVIEPQPFPLGAEHPPQLSGIPEPAPALETTTQAPPQKSPESSGSSPASVQPVVMDAPEPKQPAPPAPASRPVVRPPIARSARPPLAYAPPDPEVIRYIAPPPQRVQTSVSQPLPMKLVGTVSGPGTPMALILVDDVVREVPVGQTVLGSWRVQSVSRDGVMLSNGQQGMAMHLGLGQGQ